MIKAGALYYAIFISFLVVLLGLFVIMSVWTNHSETLLLLTSQRLERDLRSALLVAQESPSLVSYPKSVDIDLFDDGNDIVSLSRRLWGGYCIVKAETGVRFIQKSVIGLYGKDIFSNEKTALYLSDKGQYLSVSGRTVINGDCSLPKSGIRKAYIEGFSFQGTDMINGATSLSKQKLPEECSETIKPNIQYFSGQLTSSDTLGNVLLLNNDTIKQSFYNKTLVLISNDWLTISGKVLQGNIRIISFKGVTITKTAQTEDIIVYAPKIELGSGFAGHLQLFATDTIYVNDGVTLLFPTLLAIPETQNTKALISIGRGCELIGDTFLSIMDKTTTNMAEVHLNQGSTITGRVYCDGKIELKGTVNGSVYTNGFILRTPGSIYENHLLNAVINFKALPEYYSGSLVNADVENYKMVKWLH